MKFFLGILAYLIPLVICLVFAGQSLGCASKGRHGDAVLAPFEAMALAFVAFVPVINIVAVLYLYMDAYPKARAHWAAYGGVLEGGFPTGEYRRHDTEPHDPYVD